MGLDTRGFMDGALRGFELMENHYDRAERKADRERNLRFIEEQNKKQELWRQQAWDRDEDRYQERLKTDQANNDKEERRYQDGLKLKKQQLAQSNATNAAQQQYYQQQNNREKKLQFIQDNAPLIEQAWTRFNETGELSDILNNDYIKGTAYDVRSYTPDKINSFNRLRVNIPNVLSGKSDIGSLVPDIGVVYKSNIDRVIGSKDDSGKRTVIGAELANIHLASDINPEIKGDQPGLVLGLKVKYDDGSTAIKPVTKLRSSDPNDHPLIIPLDEAMKDLSGQMKLARLASTSKAYQQLFAKDNKAQKSMDKEYRGEVNKISKWYSDATLDLMKNSGGTVSPEQQEQLDKQRDEMLANLNKMYGKAQTTAVTKFTSTERWASSDETKQEYLQAMKSAGRDIDSMSVGQLEKGYQQALISKQQREKAQYESNIANRIRNNY
ncbi:hypothetical protein IHC87_18175 [Photobacterium damselae subsp. damselae]|uniref:hypothetical protein n=1 Tax=Photobacterium damselae TaxID=38293 RepID=UPI001F23FBE8|nr:hypothetical protein [Photobacterium damselae]UJZ96492.1 hypothetical protein IHC87_18175 [Photobacterium damselae subsp. damselae]UJZ99604.1 hypothetical protein IHC88_19315 [Photobacterium damselae subsp. damselae]